MNEKICDFRFAICDLTPPTCRKSGRGHNGGQLRGLLPEGINALPFQQFGVDNQFHPIGRFIGFFFNRAQLRNKLRLGASATRRPVVCPDRSPTPDQLRTDGAAFRGFRQSTHQLDHPQGKLFRTLFEFSFIHDGMRFATPVLNRKSQI
jgi:hypothetical protein